MRGAGAKRRPMLVVSDDAFNQNELYAKVLVVELTSVHRLGGTFRWEVTLPKGAAGPERTSIVKCGEVYTVLKDRLQGPAATLPAAMKREVDQALATALGLPLG